VARALDAVLQQVVQGSEIGSAPGAVLSVRGPDWRFEGAAGLADPQAGRPIDCAMPFQIGSNTKMMTAVVLLQLHEKGLLSIDDPLSRHLPQVAARLPNGEVMTLRQLAQHTSGLFSYTGNAPDGTPGLIEGGMTDGEALRRQIDETDIVDFVARHGAPTFAPGEPGLWSYSNTGYALLGQVIEKVEVLPLAKSFENRIFGPLGMTRTFLWNGIPRPDFGLPRSWLAMPYDLETTEWNMS
jgi:D-alanyl-D-alanine carboxypeptidase